VPLAVLSGAAVDFGGDGRAGVAGRPARGRLIAPIVFSGVAVVGAVGGGYTLASLLRGADAYWRQFDVPTAALVGATDAVASIEPLNMLVPPDGRVWLVGESRVFYVRARVHYTVVFNRDPWLEYARTATPEQAVAWLRTQNVSDVVFSWPEIDRLRKTYGFPDFVTHAWAAALVPAGLRRVEPPAEMRGTEIEVYEVSRE